jgi:hypothetical protein
MRAQPKRVNNARPGRQPGVAEADRPSDKKPSKTSRSASTIGQRETGSDKGGIGAALTRAQAIRELADRANRGSEQALANLRQLLDDCPDIWESVGNLARHAEMAWLDLIAGENRLTLESVKRQIARMKENLLGQHPTAMEMLLVDRIVASHLAVEHAEIQAATTGGSLAQATFRLKRVESCQKRLLSAAKALATVRQFMPRGLMPVNHLRVHDSDCKLG